MECLDETTVALFLERRLTGDEIGHVERHIDGCPACRQLVAELGRAPSPGLAEGSRGSLGVVDTLAAAPAEGERASLEVGDRVGRYVVLDVLGSGGMGTVYAAFDPELDRKVALKLLRRGAAASSEDRARLLREAQALAKVSDPGVVAIHDVGTHRDQIFLAMEFIAGGTFKTWLRERTRTASEIVAIAMQAGRGLAAAHASGLIHRDIKPDNILVDGAGRARVGDFGLALAVAATRSSSPVIAGVRAVVDDALTRTGAVVGTPAYMAPEQLAGQVVTARTDQFSFCATLYEALHGVRPYPGTSLEAIAAAMRRGRIADPPVDRDVPGHIRTAVVRGLAIDPAARFPSMDRLLAALVHEPWHRRRIIAYGALAAAALAAAAGALWIGSTDAEVCGGGDAELVGVWDPARRAEVRSAFVTAGGPPAGAEADRIAAELDRRTTAWVGARRQACEDTRVRRIQDEAVLDLRMECLAARRRQIGAVVDVLAHADAKVIDGAPDAVARLEPLAQCDDLAALRQVVRPPADPARRAQADAIAHELDELEATWNAGTAGGPAVARARALIDRAAELDYPPLHARALFWAAIFVEEVGGDVPAASDLLRASINAADRGRDDRMRFRSWAHLISISDKAGEAMVPEAAAALARIGPDPELEIHWLTAQASLLFDLDKPREASAKFLEVVDRREQLEGADTPNTAHALLSAGTALMNVDLDQAIVLVRRAVAVTERAYGTHHPKTGENQGYLATLLVAQGKFAEAAPLLEASVAIARETYGEDHAHANDMVLVLAGTYMILERYDEAAAEMKRARAVAERMFGPGTPEVAQVIQQEALLAMERGDNPRSIELHRQVIAIFSEKLGPTDPFVGASQQYLGEALRRSGMLREARTELGRGLASYAAAYGADAPDLAMGLIALGEVELALGNADKAITSLERALAMLEVNPAVDGDPEQARAALARARTKAGARR